jgi:hypothetical protein
LALDLGLYSLSPQLLLQLFIQLRLYLNDYPFGIELRMGSAADGAIIELRLDLFLWQSSLRKRQDDLAELFLLGVSLEFNLLPACPHYYYR